MSGEYCEECNHELDVDNDECFCDCHEDDD